MVSQIGMPLLLFFSSLSVWSSLVPPFLFLTDSFSPPCQFDLHICALLFLCRLVCSVSFVIPFFPLSIRFRHLLNWMLNPPCSLLIISSQTHLLSCLFLLPVFLSAVGAQPSLALDLSSPVLRATTGCLLPSTVAADLAAVTTTSRSPRS